MLTKVSDSLLIDLNDVTRAHLAPNGVISTDPAREVKCIVETKNGTLEINKDADFTYRQLCSMLVGRQPSTMHQPQDSVARNWPTSLSAA
jgi:hypothetical protein